MTLQLRANKTKLEEVYRSNARHKKKKQKPAYKCYVLPQILRSMIGQLLEVKVSSYG